MRRLSNCFNKAVSHNSTRWSITFAYEIDLQGMHTRKPENLFEYRFGSFRTRARHLLTVAATARLFIFWWGSFHIKKFKRIAHLDTSMLALAALTIGLWISRDAAAGWEFIERRNKVQKPMQAFNALRTFTETRHTHTCGGGCLWVEVEGRGGCLWFYDSML